MLIFQKSALFSLFFPIKEDPFSFHDFRGPFKEEVSDEKKRFLIIKLG